MTAHYRGERILHKHATYQEFLRRGPHQGHDYLVFSGVRNPLDDVVSVYQKLKNNHKQAFTDPEKARRLGRRSWMRYRFVQAGGGFEPFFLRFYRIPYDNISRLAKKRSQVIIRFEALQAGFSQVLRTIGVDQIRELPSVNQTAGRRPYLEHYSPGTIPRAMRVFGPFMEAWGYRFPEEWQHRGVSRISRGLFHVLGSIRGLYWRLR